MKRKKRRSHTFLPVLAGFLALYLMLMSIATFLIKEQYMDIFEASYRTIFTDLTGRIKTFENANKWMAEGNTKEAAKDFAYVLSSALSESDDAWFQCSCALYDQEQTFLTKSQNVLPCSKLREPPSAASQLQVYYEAYDNYLIDEYLNQEDLESLAYYIDKMRTSFIKKWRSQSPVDENGSILPDYRVSITLVKGTDIPVQILVQEMDWNGENQTRKTRLQKISFIFQTLSGITALQSGPGQIRISISRMNRSIIFLNWKFLLTLLFPIFPRDMRNGCPGRKMSFCRICGSMMRYSAP